VDTHCVRGRPWRPDDRTGGPIDQVFDHLRQHIPDLLIERLDVTHPADDDNVYFLGLGEVLDIVQVDTGPQGQPPFTVESDDRVDTVDPAEAFAAIETRLEQDR
jgi:hypothetical protein